MLWNDIKVITYAGIRQAVLTSPPKLIPINLCSNFDFALGIFIFKKMGNTYDKCTYLLHCSYTLVAVLKKMKHCYFICSFTRLN